MSLTVIPRLRFAWVQCLGQLLRLGHYNARGSIRSIYSLVMGLCYVVSVVARGMLRWCSDDSIRYIFDEAPSTWWSFSNTDSKYWSWRWSVESIRYIQIRILFVEEFYFEMLMSLMFEGNIRYIFWRNTPTVVFICSNIDPKTVRWVLYSGVSCFFCSLQCVSLFCSYCGNVRLNFHWKFHLYFGYNVRNDNFM